LDAEKASDDVINQIVEKSEGMFLYAYLVLDEIRARQLFLQHLADFPEGLTGYYKGWFSRKFSDPESYHCDFHQLVSVVIAHKAPLPLNVLSNALGLSPWELDRRLDRLGVLFPLREEGQSNQKLRYVTLMHKSLHDWLTELNPATLHPKAGEFAADPELGNRLLVEEGWKVYTSGKLVQHGYFSRTLLSHLSEAQEADKLASVLLDPALLDTVWSNEMRYEWQSHISNLRHACSLTNLVQKWLREHGALQSATTYDAVVAGKLGRLFQEMGAFDEAILLAEAALRIWEVNNVADSPDMVSSLLAIGSIRSAREELGSAAASYERALAIAQRAYAQDSPQMAEVFYQLCVFYTQGKRDYTKAWDCLEKSLAILSRGNPPDLAGIANCVNDKAVILTAEGKVADYLGIYREALALFEKARPTGHPEMVATLGNIANELRKEGKPVAAVEALRRAVKMAEDILLPQHHYYGFVRIALASCLLEMGKYDESLEVMRTYVSELERFPGPDHEDTAQARLQFCQTLWNAVHLSDSAKRGGYSEQIRRQCQRIRAAKPATVLGLLDLAEGSRKIGELSLRDCLTDTALRSCRNNANLPRGNVPESVSATSFADVCELLASTKPLRELAPQVLSLWEHAEPQMRHLADYLPKTRKLIVELISWTGRTRFARDGAVEEVHQAFDLISKIGAETPETLDQLAALAVSLHHRQHHEISESLCQRLVETSELVLGPEHIQTLTYLENFAFMSMYRGKFDEAEGRYRETLRRRCVANGIEQCNTLSTITGLAECLLLRGSTEDARKLIHEFAPKLPIATGFSSARKTLARSLRSRGQQLKNEFSAFDASKVCYELSLEMDADDAATHNNMALLFWVCLNDPSAAADHFTKALALEPTDGNTHSNYGHLLGQTMSDPKEALMHFKQATSLCPNDGGVFANYAALLLQQGDLPGAWKLAKRSKRLCLPAPDRTMARPLFCAAPIALLRGRDSSVTLGQLKGLFLQGIDHVTWVITALLGFLERELPQDSFELMRAISNAINDKKRIDALDAISTWSAVQPVSFSTPWPEF